MAVSPNNTVYALDASVGVETLLDDTDTPLEYFDMQGMRVDNPSKGIFIVRRGSKVGKVLIR